jgi:hypothetical protein
MHAPVRHPCTPSLNISSFLYIHSQTQGRIAALCDCFLLFIFKPIDPFIFTYLRNLLCVYVYMLTYVCMYVCVHACMYVCTLTAKPKEGSQPCATAFSFSSSSQSIHSFSLTCAIYCMYVCMYVCKCSSQ